MIDKKYVMGFFADEKGVISTIKEMEKSPWPVHQVHSPIPSPAIGKSMKLKRSRLDFFTVTGVLTGFILGFWLVDPTAGQWNLILGGKTDPGMATHILNGILFAILFGVIATITGIIILTMLPGYRRGIIYDEKCSGEHWAILSSCHRKEQEGLLMLFIKNKGNVKIIE